MIPIAKNIQGDVLPVLTPYTAGAFQVDGSIAHAEAAALPHGIYRISVRTSTGNAGVMIAISIAGTYATTTAGMFMAHNAAEYFILEEGSIISVIEGKISVCPFK